MTYQVRLAVFEGPFDLLLHLISRRQVEVTEVDLADITADYVRTLREGLGEVDLEAATRFLMVAATLIELKAARLLPAEQREAVEDLLGEARDRLYARLLEYQAYRDLAHVLRDRHEANAWRLGREAVPEPWMLRVLRPVVVPLDPAGLAALAARVLAPVPPAPVDLSHIRRTTISVHDAAELVLGVIDEDRVLDLPALTAGRSRADRIAVFLAILELFKLGAVDLEQREGGPIEISLRGTLAAAAEVLALLDENLEADARAAGVGAGSDDVPGGVPAGVGT